MSFVRPWPFIVLLLLAATSAHAQAPSTLAGVTLGDAASQYKGRLVLSKAATVGDAPWLRRIPVRADAHFDKGYVLVGTCAAPGRGARSPSSTACCRRLPANSPRTPPTVGNARSAPRW